MQAAHHGLKLATGAISVLKLAYAQLACALSVHPAMQRQARRTLVLVKAIVGSFYILVEALEMYVTIFPSGAAVAEVLASTHSRVPAR